MKWKRLPVVEFTPLQQHAAKELLRRRRAQHSIAAFRECMIPTLSPDFQHEPALHHLIMIRELERLERGEIRRLMILAPPGSAKSTYSSIQYPLWRLANKPHEHILCASNTQDLAETFNRRRRSIALSPEWMTLAQTKLAEDLQSVGNFGTEKHGSIRAAGIGSSITGNRSHLNILDDPIKGVEEAYSQKTLDFQFDWFNNEFRTRLVPGGKELIVCTRWAKKDIAGRILDLVKNGHEDWTVLRLPMIADSPDDPLGRKLGDPLWPEWFTSQHIAEKLRNPLLWATQYQQTPLDESGSWIGYENLQFEDRPDESTKLKFVIAVDLALSVGKGDFTVFVVAGIDSQRRIHIVHVDRERVSPEKTVDRLFTLCDHYQPSEVLIDDDNASKVFVRYLIEAFRNRNKMVSMPPINPLPMRGHDKETRATAIRAMFLADNVRITRANWNNDFVRECLEFPSGDHDDIVDALGLIGRRMPLLSSPPREPHLSGEDPQRGQMIVDYGDGPKLNIPLNRLFEEREEFRRRRERL
jgi:predicted phage terminase large subunit-like protein